MNFYQRIANYILGNEKVVDLPEIAILGLKEGLESNSLMILASLTNKDNTFEIEDYYKRSLKELRIQEPSKLEAAILLLEYHLIRMIRTPSKCYEIMKIIDNKIYKAHDWPQTSEESKKYRGSELGIQRLYTWYREIQDWEGNGFLLYYTNLSRKEQRVKFEVHLVEEAKKWLEKHKLV